MSTTARQTYIPTSLPLRSRKAIFLQNVKEVILQNMDNQHFDVAQLARKVFLSTSQLNRRLNALIGCSAGQLIRDIRMRHAANLLLNASMSIGNVAFEVGYINQANFCRCFKQWAGCSPRAFSKRRSH